MRRSVPGRGRRRVHARASHLQPTALFLAALRRHAGGAAGERLARSRPQADRWGQRGRFPRGDRASPSRPVATSPDGRPVRRVWGARDREARCGRCRRCAQRGRRSPRALQPRDVRGVGGRSEDMVREHRCRPLRRRLGVLIDKTGGPDVTARSFDVENRAALGREAPRPARPARRQPDETTRQGRSDRAQSLPEPPADRDPLGARRTSARIRTPCDGRAVAVPPAVVAASGPEAAPPVGARGGGRRSVGRGRPAGRGGGPRPTAGTAPGRPATPD